MHILKEELIASTEDPKLYEASLDAIPGDIVGVRGKIKTLALYPIKGVHPIYLEEARLSDIGLETIDEHLHDRMAMPVRIESGSHPKVGSYECQRLSQKDMPHLARVHLAYREEGLLRMSKRGIPRYAADIDVLGLCARDGRVSRALIPGKNPSIVEGVLLEEGPVVAALKTILFHYGERVDDLGLLVPHMGFSRASDTQDDPQVGTMYSDGAQLHIANESTRKFLNRGLKKQNGRDFPAIDMVNFRPNIVIGDVRANIEDLIGSIQVLSVIPVDIRFAGPTPRCIVPCRDPKTGERLKGGEPLRWLAKHRPRRSKDKGVTFGINADTASEDSGTIIRRGDEFVVTEESSGWER